MRVEKLIPNPNNPSAPYVRLILDDNTAVEFPVRKATFDSLAAAEKQLAYVLECKEFHSGDGPGWVARRAARRAAWDADDKTKTDAAVAAAKAAEEAKFVVTPQGYVKDDKDTILGVQVTVTYHGLTATMVIPNDAASAAANARKAFADVEARANAEKAALAAFAMVK